MKSSPILIFDNSIVREALLRSLPEDYESIPFFENNSNSVHESPEQCVNSIKSLSVKPGVILVNVDYRFTKYPRLSAGGLRLVELLRMEKALSVPILVYSWRSLEELRSDPSLGFSLVIDSLELTDETNDTLTRFVRLPFSSVQLIDAIDRLNKARLAFRDRLKQLQVARILLENEMERLCRSIRHRYQNVLAAQRLLLGAYLAGDISFDLLAESADKIGNKDHTLLNQITVLREKWSEVEQELSNARPLKAKPQVSSVPFVGTILVVDDHFEADPDTSPVAGSIGDFGWSHVYRALFQTRQFQFNIIGATSYDEAIKHINVGSLAGLRLIILDVDLGAPDKSGLHLLQLIRSYDPFVPVLVMTSFDDAEVCQTALELQADGFFAKQLRNETDRTSLDYYNSLVKAVRKILQDSIPDRDLYDRFSRLIPIIAQEDEAATTKGTFQRVADGVLNELTKFFLLLRVIKRHHLARTLLTNHRLKTPEKSFDELMLILMDAILAWPNWRIGPPQTRIDNFEEWLRRTDLHEVEVATFHLDHEANVIDGYWSPESEEFFGHESHEINGMHFQALIESGSYCPSHNEMEIGWRGPVCFRRKAELPSKMVDIDVRPLNGSFKVSIVENIRRFIVAGSRWAPIRHNRKLKVSIGDVRSLARRFLETISSVATYQAKEQRQHKHEFVFNETLSQVITRARKRERSLIREHVIKSKMGSTAILLGGYFASADATVPATQIDTIIDGFWTSGVDPEWNGEFLLSVLEEPSEQSLLYLPLKNGQSSPFSVLIIDDHARSNCWAYVSQLIHHDAIINNIEFIGAEVGANFESYVETLASDWVRNADLIFLDLRMPAFQGEEPSVETGLRVAELIKRLDPVVPVILLSAHNDAITMRRGIAYGATDFFPKEAPYSRTAADMVDYFNQFSYLPQKLGIEDEAWIKFSERCRRTLYNLDLLAEQLNSFPPLTSLPRFLMCLLNEKILQSNLPQMLKVETIQEVHAAVVSQIVVLFRRALFFAFLSRERYLSPWISYFAHAIPGMRAEMLAYDQVWIDCGMIVEFTFNVVGLGCCRAQKTSTPGDRSYEEKSALKSLLGADPYDLGTEIWRKRNDRRYGRQGAAPTGEADAREIIEACINFLSGLGLIELTPPSPTTISALQSLRENLEKSSRRRKIALQVADQEKSIRRLNSHSVFLSNEMDNLLLNTQRLKEAKEDLERLNAKAVLDERHRLLSHLLI